MYWEDIDSIKRNIYNSTIAKNCISRNTMIVETIELWIVSCNFEMSSTYVFKFVSQVYTMPYVYETIHFRRHAISNVTYIYLHIKQCTETRVTDVEIMYITAFVK